MLSIRYQRQCWLLQPTNLHMYATNVSDKKKKKRKKERKKDALIFVQGRAEDVMY